MELPFNIMPVFFDSGIMRGLVSNSCWIFTHILISLIQSPSGRLESVVLGPFNHLDLANFSKKHESEIQEGKSMLKLYYAGTPGGNILF